MDRPLRVLVCSGNMGNALPDPESIASWIPKDGCYSQVVNNPDYPLPSPQERDALLQEVGLPPLKVNSEEEETNNSNHFIHNPEDDYFDIIVVGMQEATFAVKEQDGQVKKELVPIVTPLLNKAQKEFKKTTKKGFATVTTLTGSTDHTSTSPKVYIPEWLKAEDSSLLHQLLQDQCPSYDFAIRFQRGEMRLEVLVRKDLEAKVLSVRAQNTGLVNLAANKGGIVGELLVGGTTRLSFCTAHLQAHEGNENYWHRCQMLTDIFSGTADDTFSPAVKYDQTLKSHYCFVLGDLNFRSEIDSTLEKLDHHNQVMTLVQEQNWQELNRHDELFRALKNKDVAVGFETLPCLFPPTFKVERQDGFEYKEQRRPSYTDRILWKCGDKLCGRVTPTAYEPIEHFTTSDHKPIRGAFEIQLNERVRLREPRMQRRQSLRALRTLGFMNMRSSQSAKAPPQTLHMFVSNLRCTIYQKRKYSEKDYEPNGSALKSPASQKIQEVSRPDVFMAFLSYPKRLVREERTTWQRIEGLFRGPGGLRKETNDDGTISRTAGGWPRTKKLFDTFDPDWSDEGEIHLKVKSHDKHGVPLEHTGSILYFSAFNAANLDLSLMGTYAMNLGMLCSNASTTQRSRLNGRASVFLKNQAMSEMTSFEIDQPLLKNGRETGRLYCDVDACWLDDASSSHNLHTMKNDAKQKRLLKRVKSR